MHPYVPEACGSLPTDLRGIPKRSRPPGLNPPFRSGGFRTIGILKNT
jgi:hypothetical protein